VTFVERFYPDPFVFVILLTGVTLCLAVGLTDTSATGALTTWGEGLTGLLPFITQIALTLLCAHALAHTDFVHGIIHRLAAWPRSDRQAYGLVAAVAGVGSLLAWSLGLVVGALIALAVARSGRERGLRLHFPLLVASAYAGFVVWHMGYSSSAALFVATPGHALEAATGIIPVSETIFAPWNLVLAAVTLVVVAAACASLAPRDTQPVELVEQPSTEGPNVADRSSFGRWLETNRVVSVAMGGLLIAYLVSWFHARGLELTLDVVNWSFLGVGLLLARSPIHYVELILNASRTLGPIVLQYPFYAGIMALMTRTDLIHIFSDGFVAISSPGSLGFWAFISGGVLNFFIPSGGGQWAVQGPIFIEAAQKLGVATPVVVMGVAYGDQWTNLIQPFWTLPMLAIVGLNARAIMGYCFVILIATFFLFGGTLLWVGAGG
jgi:short-chain fatty acids transporter